MYKILNTIGEVYTDSAKNILEEIGDVDYKNLTQDELKDIIDNYDIAIIGLGLNFTRDILENAKKLKIIVTATTGLDHVDVEYAKEKGIEIVSLRGEDEFLNMITGTAELAAGLMIELLRFMPWASGDVKNYRWDRESFRGRNLYGLTLGVIGLGRLGKWMARYGNAFGMDVLYHDPKLLTSNVDSLGTEASFDELLQKSDVISIHVHLNKETENMFNAEVFKKMKNTAYLINTARGDIVHEGDLLNALQSQEIAGYGTDVLAGELNFNKEFSKHHWLNTQKKVEM